MEKMREQKRTNCNCTVCGRKRMAIEELESLYEAYNDIKPSSEEQDSDSLQARRWEPFNFGNSLTIKGGILTVAEDLLKNDGKKFIDMMESLAEKRTRREEEMEALAADYIWDGTEDDYDEDQLTGDEDEYEDDDEEYEETTDTEEDRWAESKRLLQMFAAKMFEQRVMAAYRERVANERQRKFLEELEEENRLKEEREAKKQRDKEKKKNKKKQQKLAKEEEKARREAEKAEAEAQLKAKQAEKLEEARRKKLEQKQKKEAERKQIEDERRRKLEDEKQRESERKLEKQRREQQEKEAKEVAKKLAEEKAENERREKENAALAAQQEAAKRKQQHQKQLLHSLQQHAQEFISPAKTEQAGTSTTPRPKADPALLASLQQPLQQSSPRIFDHSVIPASLPLLQPQGFHLQDSFLPTVTSQPSAAWPTSQTSNSVSLAGIPRSPDIRAPAPTAATNPGISTTVATPLGPLGFSPLYNSDVVNMRSPPRAEVVTQSPPAVVAPIQRPTSGSLEQEQRCENKAVEELTKQMGSSALLADDDEDDELLLRGAIQPVQQRSLSVNSAIPRGNSMFGGPGLVGDPFDGTTNNNGGNSSNSWNPLLGSLRRGSMWSSNSATSIPAILSSDLNGSNGALSNSIQGSAMLSCETIQQAAIKAYQHQSPGCADGFVPAHILYRSTVGSIKGGESINIQDFYMACGSPLTSSSLNGMATGQFQLVRDGFGLVTHIKYLPSPPQPQLQQFPTNGGSLLQQQPPQQRFNMFSQTSSALPFKNPPPPGMAIPLNSSLNY